MAKSKAAPVRRGPAPLDPLEQYREAARLAQAGNKRLSDSVDILRNGLEMLTVAEIDNETRPPRALAPSDFRRIAAEILDQYAAVSGVNWRLRKNRLIGSRAGDRSLSDSYSDEGHGGAGE